MTTHQQLKELVSEMRVSLAAIATMAAPDNLFELDAIPREPVIDEVIRLKGIADLISLIVRSMDEQP